MKMVLPTALERRQLLEDEVARCLPILVRLGAEKVILIGSLARGRVNPLSDLDLIVVLETSERFLDRLERVREALDAKVSLDLFVYTPREFRELQTWSSFLDHALKEGKVLYDGGPAGGVRTLAGASAPRP
jgi:predicted nucleotidyltransferase